MRLLKINISNFGLFHNKTLTLSSGLNLIYGKNERGKSTIHGFIKGMLFGIEKTRGRPGLNDMYDKYQPWDRPGSYDGSLEFEANNQIYHLYRNFDKNNKETILTDVETGRNLKFSEERFQRLIGGLTTAGYDGTVSIEQLKAKTDHELRYVLQNHITNLTMTKTEEIDVKKTLESLQVKLKQYDLKSLVEEIKILKEEIIEGQRTEDHIDDLTVQLDLIQTDEERLINKKKSLIDNKFYTREELNNLFIKFPIIQTKYGYYLDQLDQSNFLQEKIRSQLEEIGNKQKDENQLKLINSSIENIESYKQEYKQVSKELSKYTQQEDELKMGRIRNLKFLIPFLIIGLFISLLSYNKNDFLLKLGISAFIIGIILFIVLNFFNNNKKKDFNLEYKNLEDDLDIIENNIIKVLDKNNVTSELEIKRKYEVAIREQENLYQLEKDLQRLKDEYSLQLEKINNLRNEIADYVNKFIFIYPEILQDKLEINDEIIGILDEYINDEKLKISEYEINLKPKLRDLSIKREKIKWEIELLENNEQELLDKQEKLEELLQKKQDYEEEILGINLAKETIQKLSEEIHNSFGTELNNLTSDIIKEITNSKYNEIKVDEKLNIKTEIGDKYHRIESLSTGTIEQVYFSLRLAIADMIYGQGKVPILLDDTFAYYDDDRLKRVLEMLSKENNRQILLFTCQNREKEILDEVKATYNYIKL